jgi:hypothetical protein
MKVAGVGRQRFLIRFAYCHRLRLAERVHDAILIRFHRAASY